MQMEDGIFLNNFRVSNEMFEENCSLLSGKAESIRNNDET